MLDNLKIAQILLAFLWILIYGCSIVYASTQHIVINKVKNVLPYVIGLIPASISAFIQGNNSVLNIILSVILSIAITWGLIIIVKKQ